MTPRVLNSPIQEEGAALRAKTIRRKSATVVGTKRSRAEKDTKKKGTSTEARSGKASRIEKKKKSENRLGVEQETNKKRLGKDRDYGP